MCLLLNTVCVTHIDTQIDAEMLCRHGDSGPLSAYYQFSAAATAAVSVS